MKLNFWQWLGLIIVVVAGAYWIYDRVAQREAEPAPEPAGVVVNEVFVVRLIVL